MDNFITHAQGINQTTDLSINIARGKITGSEPFGAYGKRITSGSITTSLLWADGQWSIPSASGEQVRVVSTSSQDSASGTGIQSLNINYLDENLVSRTEQITLNGTTPVLTNATNIRFVQIAYISSVGSTKAAVGTIKFTNIANTKTYNQISPLELRCSSTLRMIPKGKQAVILGLVGSSISGSSASKTLINLGVSYFAGYDYTSSEILLPIGTVGVQDDSVTYNLPIPHIAPEGTLIGMTCSTDKGATIAGDWFGWLENI